MLGEMALKYYSRGLSCSSCIIRAAARVYGINTGPLEGAVNAVAGGFGIGAMCSIPIACVLVIGLLYPKPEEAKAKRLQFLLAFKAIYGSLDCSRIKAAAKGKGCKQVIRDGCDILEGLVQGQ